MPTNTNKPVVTKKGIYMAKDIDDLNSKAHIEKFGKKTIERYVFVQIFPMFQLILIFFQDNRVFRQVLFEGTLRPSGRR